MGDLLEIVDNKAEKPEVKTGQQKKIESIDLKQLINRLNYINFQDGTLSSVFSHKNYNRTISIDMKPKACLDSQLSCFWPDPDMNYKETSNYNLKKIYIDDGIRTIVINPENVSYEPEGFTIDLPEVNILKPSRKTRRHSVKGIQAQLIQNGVLYRGDLINFAPESFEIEIQSKTLHAANTFNSDADINVTLVSDQQIKFSGECTVTRTFQKKNIISCILKPKYNQIRRLQAKEYRSFRQKLIPSPNIVFIHPFTGIRVDLPVYDLSGAGFSVEENQRTSALLPGMIISELDIVFSTGMKVTCKCQVLYKKYLKEQNHSTVLICGFSIIDMKPFDHVQLLAMIFLAKNKNIYLSSDLDSDSLWRFLFESGFIYPGKYSYLKDYKSQIMSTYKKIYSNAPDIARHVTYQEKGEIFGHASMLRSYENTWLIHHHAASNSSSTIAGLHVLDQLADYAYEANKIKSMHLNYLLGYYRPENKFPARIFGGSAKSINNSKKCSLDDVAFLKFQTNSDKIFDSLGNFKLEESSDEDLMNLESYYNDISGGLMLEALDILPDNSGSISVLKAYEQLQFKREIKLYSLKANDNLLAVLIIDITDTGMNMSELTNNIKVLVLDQDNLEINLLENCINELVKIYFDNYAHILLFPASYADKNSMQYEKIYRMWILDVNHSDGFYKYLKRMIRFVKP